jgi:predicted dehydrogenase
MTNIAFLGCVHIHTPGFISMIKKRSDVKVKSVWDHLAVRGQKRAEELGATFAQDFNSVLADPDVAAIVVCSETDRHESLVLPTVKAKKHLFVEKPLGYKSTDAQSMAAAIEKAGLIFQTGYFRRGDAALQFLKKHVDAGSFGKITRVRGSNCHSGALGGWFDSKPNDPTNDWRWMADPQVSGCGAYGDLGTHMLDILLWMFGEVDSVTGSLNTGTARYGDCDETGEGILKFKSGAIGTLAASWDDVADPVSFQICGTEGNAAIVKGDVLFTSKKAGFDGSQPVRKSELSEPLGHAFELFLDAITGKKGVPLVTAKEAAYRSMVMEAIYEGAKTNAWVKPK